MPIGINIAHCVRVSVYMQSALYSATGNSAVTDNIFHLIL